MSKIVGFPDANDPVFWNLYDRFCKPEHLEEFIKTEKSDLVVEMCKLMEAFHQEGLMYDVCHLGRGWEKYKAWLTLRNAPIMNKEGNMVVQMRIGDVIVAEHGWCLDVSVTHNPIHEYSSRYLLSGNWEQTFGLFMPLFDKATIFKCIELRVAKNAEEAIARAQKQAVEWKWY